MKILVFGEYARDEFIYGNCNRLNPEAPTPVIKPNKTITYDGMGGNVSRNLKSLGVEVKHIYQPEQIIKRRYVDDKSNYILLRVDYEDDIRPLQFSDPSELFIKYDIESFDAVIISDYNKGFLTTDVIKLILEKSKISFIDTKKPIRDWIIGADFIKINEFEKNNISNDLDVIDQLKDKLIITYGGNGCMYDGINFKTDKVDVLDVVGAGDSFLASLASAYVKTKDIRKSINFANSCATFVVQKRGVSDLKEMKYYFDNL